MKENNNNKIVSITVELSGKTEKLSGNKNQIIGTKLIEVPTSYKILISLPVLCETEVEGKTIIDDSFYDYTIKKIKDKFSKNKVRDTLLHLYDSGHSWNTNGILRGHNETSLDKILEKKGMYNWVDEDKVEYESKVEIYYGKYTGGKSKFDKITLYDDLLERRTNKKFDWLSILSFSDDSRYGSGGYAKEEEEECSEEYTNLIWNIWKKHLDGNLKEYSVFFSNDRDYEKIEYEIKNKYREDYDTKTEMIWKPKKKVFTGTIKGLSKYDAINKYQNNETDLENVKYVSIDEVPDDSIRLGKVSVAHKRFQPNAIPKESDLLEMNTSKKECNKDFTLPEGARFIEPEIKEVA